MTAPAGAIRCYWLDHTERVRLELRRYVTPPPAEKPCSAHGYHDVRVPWRDAPARWETEPDGTRTLGVWRGRPPGPRVWPRYCDCGFDFGPMPSELAEGRSTWDLVGKQVAQVNQHLVYQRADTGAIVTLPECGPGAMWDAWWLRGFNDPGPDGRHLMVRTPGGDWEVDGRATNCQRPDWKEHHCWQRSGTVPDVLVQRGPGPCGTGGGSIGVGGYHGFLGPPAGWLVLG